MGDQPYCVRPGTAEDLPAILSLMAASLGEGSIPRTTEFWSWKHEQNPFGPSYFWVADAAGELVGVRVFMRWTWHCDGQPVRAVRAVDTATHPGWQGRGIFKKLTLGLADDLVKRDVSFVFNTPNDQSRPGYLKMGWVRAGRISLWVRPQRPLQFARAAWRKREAVSSGDRSMAGLDSAVLDSSDIDELLRGLELPSGRYHTPVDRAYLRWRYLRCPAAQYGFATFEPKRDLIAYRLRVRRGLRELTLCDVFVEQSARGLRSAVQSLRALVRSSEPDYAVCAARLEPFVASVMLASGFVAAPYVGPVVVVRPLNRHPALPDPRRLSTFRYSIGDMELF
jgi:hypothetical protein